MRHGLREPVADRFAIPGFSGLQSVGGWGAVNRYRGFLAGRDVLVCAIVDGHPAGSAIRSRLAAMEAALLELDHPNLQETIEVLASEPARLVVSWPGEATLVEVCSPGHPGLDPAVAIGHALELCRGLSALHAAGLVHLGLRPASIYFQDGVLRILDLGLASGAAGDPPGPEDAILAPEQILGLPVDIRTDLHGVGALLYRLVMGAWPWVIAHQGDLDAWARAELPVWPQGNLAPGLQAVLRRLLARAPENRYASPAEAMEDLERVSHGFSPVHAKVATATRHRLQQAPGTATVDHLRRSPSPDQRVTSTVPSVQPARPATSPGMFSPILLGAGGGGLAVLAGLLLWLGNRPAPVVPVPAEPIAVPAKSAGPAWASASGRDAQGPWAEVTVGTVVQRLRRLPAGDAWIGSPQDEPGRKEGEDRFQFTLSRDLWCADSEVTQALFQEVMGRNPSQFRGENLPVENVTWQDANQFCVRLGQRIPGLHFRLPSEAEWEYACRAGIMVLPLPAPAGQPVCWDVETSSKVTHPVRRLGANAWGLFDCRGNVMEWTADAMAPYPREAQVDRRVTQGAQRVAPGGGWSSGPSDTRPASRFHFMSVAHLSFLGFRFVAE